MNEFQHNVPTEPIQRTQHNAPTEPFDPAVKSPSTVPLSRLHPVVPVMPIVPMQHIDYFGNAAQVEPGDGVEIVSLNRRREKIYPKPALPSTLRTAWSTLIPVVALCMLMGGTAFATLGGAPLIANLIPPPLRTAFCADMRGDPSVSAICTGSITQQQQFQDQHHHPGLQLPFAGSNTPWWSSVGHKQDHDQDQQEHQGQQGLFPPADPEQNP